MSDSSRTLADLQPGERAVVATFPAEPGTQRLREMGLVAGTRVRLLRFAPMGDPLELEVRGYRLSLRRAEAALIPVQEAAKP
ncbi:MAG: ferrous iron transport protein A [Verrucomicrobia bacterium]|nr:ferrous iron transport protein A [Verrucomicrobiota bacterium]